MATPPEMSRSMVKVETKLTGGNPEAGEGFWSVCNDLFPLFLMEIKKQAAQALLLQATDLA